MKIGEIRKRVRHWQNKLLLNQWEIFVEFKKLGVALGKCESSNTYYEAYLTFNKNKLKEITDDTIRHEIIHILTSELNGFVVANSEISTEDLNYYDERLVSYITKLTR